MNKKRKGFTIAEAVVATVVIAVIAVVTMPVLNQVKNVKDPQIYKKGIYSLQRGLQRFMESSDYETAMAEARNRGVLVDESLFLANFTQRQVCEGIANQLNTRGLVNCDIRGSFDNPNFITADGIKFWSLGGNAPIPTFNKFNYNGGVVTVDMDTQNGPTADDLRRRGAGHNAQSGLRILITHRGQVFPEEDSYEATLIKDFTKLRN